MLEATNDIESNTMGSVKQGKSPLPTASTESVRSACAPCEQREKQASGTIGNGRDEIQSETDFPQNFADENNHG